MSSQFNCSTAKRWVVKIGSSLITDVTAGINVERIQNLAKQIADLKADGIEIVVVSSGSIVEGMQRLGWQNRPHEVHLLQVAAAVGQMGLIRHYETAFEQYKYKTAQILLTNADLESRSRYLNARNTLRSLLEFNTIPIVNENDTVATDEIRLGDNDTLAGLVANLVEAELLVILTDQDGLFEQDPREKPSARLVTVDNSMNEALRQMAGPGTAYGRGGMRTKVEAARRAAQSGTATVIGSGLDDAQLRKIHANQCTGTLLIPPHRRLDARQLWLAGQLRVLGTLTLDDGAANALARSGSSLLPVGVTHVEGKFGRGDLVVCRNSQNREIAKGLVNYSSDEADRLKGKHSNRIVEILEYVREPELIHRDNMVLVD